VFIFEKKPFNNKVLSYFDYKVGSVKSTPLPSKASHFIASPNLLSKLSPSVLLSKSPCINKRYLVNDAKVDKKNMLLKYIANTSVINEDDVYSDTDEEVTVTSLPPQRRTLLLNELNKSLKNTDNLMFNILIDSKSEQ
jgi:hypothetical protein